MAEAPSRSGAAGRAGPPRRARRATRGHQVAAGDQRLLVGQRDASTPTRAPPRQPHAAIAGRRHDHQLDIVRRGELDQPPDAQFVRGRRRATDPRTRRGRVASPPVCARNASPGRPAARPRTSKRSETRRSPPASGGRSSRSSPEPRCRSHDPSGHEQRVAGKHRRARTGTIDPVEDPAVARHEEAGLLAAGRGASTSTRRGSPACAARPTAGPMTSGCQGSSPMSARRGRRQGRAQQPAKEALDRLARADVLDEAPATEGPSGQVGPVS